MKMNAYIRPRTETMISVFRSRMESRTNQTAASITNPAISRRKNTMTLTMPAPDAPGLTDPGCVSDEGLPQSDDFDNAASGDRPGTAQKFMDALLFRPALA